MLKLGELLKAEREKKNLTIEDIVEEVRIKPLFIKYLEEGNYENLPEKTYIEGFVKNYSNFLDLDFHKMLAIFRREFNEHQEKNIIPENIYKKKNSLYKLLRFTPISFLVIIFVIFIFIFMAFSYREAFFPPYLKVIYPVDNQVIKSYIIIVKGKASGDSLVTVNGQSTIVGSNGNFFQSITLLPGQNSIEVDAINKFGKKTVETVAINLP